MDWQALRISDLGRIVTGRTPPSEITGLFGDGVPFITPTDITDSNRFVRTDRGLSAAGEAHLGRIMLPERAVCFVCIGATIGKMCMTDRPSVTNQQVNSVIVDRRHHCPEFVYYLLRSKVDDIKGRAGGAATPIINKTAFSEVEVLVPPLPI
jgi:type I restriction enzyme S subunit